MIWCPKCGTEYSEGESVCAACGGKLVNREAVPEDGEYGAFEGEALLANVNGPVELSYITSILGSENIRYRVMEEGAGQYLTILLGKSYTGANIYVGKGDYERASEILKSYKAGIKEEE